MIIAYKLTDSDMQTHNMFQWELGKEYTTSGKGNLCSAGWLHFYTHPLLAMLLNPIHADIKNPRLFMAEVGGKNKLDHGLKVGYTRGRLTKEMPLPMVTTEQSVRFAILCALEVYDNADFIAWANKWLSGEDKTEAAAEAAEAEAGAAVWAGAAAGAWAGGNKEINLIAIAIKVVGG